MTVIEIKYKALHWDNYQGGSGDPFDGRLIRTVGEGMTLDQLYSFALAALKEESDKNKNRIGNYILVNIVVEDPY